MTGEVFALGVLALLTVVISVVLWNVFATARAKTSAGREADYERLAERAVDAEERTAASLADLARHLGVTPESSSTDRLH